LKTTKILVLTLLLALGFTASSNAQFYVKLGGGYGFLPLGGFQYDATPNDTIDDPTSKTLGQGIMPTLGLGYMFTKNISLELNGYYLIGTKIDPSPGLKKLETGETHTTQGMGIFFAPSLVVSTTLKSVKPYARMGLLIGMPQAKLEDTRVDEGTTYTEKTTLKGGIGIGLDAGLGLNITASKKIDVFVELFGNTINWRPKDSEITETNIPGHVTGTTTFATGTGKYSAPTVPFGSFGGKVGVSIMFGKAPKK
jgi:outer membrane protein W